jgi:2-C-methyl-D-erythritol 2,4-cyclodiphosphate synthase
VPDPSSINNKPASNTPHPPPDVHRSFRIGHGYDLHRLEPLPPKGAGRPLILGGVRLEHDAGPISHSDGDALLHAVTDALLGALGEPDIGQLFPDTDPRHESQDSMVFLLEAARRVRAGGYEVVNLDATVILERPKIGPLKGQMRANIAEGLGVDIQAVNIKGKTHERVDAVGEGRAIEVHCVVMLGRR